MQSKTVAAWVLASLLTGCATARQVTFTTSPPDAAVHVNGQFIGRTPVAVPLTCDHPQTVRFDREGYDPFEQLVPTKREFSDSNPFITWVETQCVPGVHVPLRAEKKS